MAMPGNLIFSPVPNDRTLNPFLARNPWASIDRFMFDEQMTAIERSLTYDGGRPPLPVPPPSERFSYLKVIELLRFCYKIGFSKKNLFTFLGSWIESIKVN